MLLMLTKYNRQVMKIRVIGCSGAELPGHNAPGFLLDDEIIFDAGSITSVLTAKEQLRIKHIFITHAHLDHIRSIPFLADNIIIKNRSSEINFGRRVSCSEANRSLIFSLLTSVYSCRISTDRFLIC